MQVEHSSKYNLFTGAGVNKCSLVSTGSAATSSNRSLTIRTDDSSSKAPKMQYLTPTCVLFTYDDADIGTLLDEHFRKSLANAGKASTRHRNLPPSFWNRHYSRAHRSSALANAAAAAAAASIAVNPGNAANGAGFGYYQDAYSSLLRSQHSAAAAASLCWPSYGAGHQAFAAAVGAHQSSMESADGASTSGHSAYGLAADGSILNGHINEAVHAYNPFLSLTRPAANAGFVGPARLPAPPQYQSIRNDWTAALPTAAAMDSVARDFTTAHHATYQFSGLNPTAPTHHFPISDAHSHKDALCFPHVQ